MSRNRTLLVVDDEPDFCEFIATVARAKGYETTKVCDPREFEADYRRVLPDVVVIDMIMPHIDGFEIIEWLASERQPSKVAFVSGVSPFYARSGALLSAAKGGLEVHSLMKPVSIDQIESLLLE